MIWAGITGMKISGRIKLNITALSLALIASCAHSSVVLASNGTGAGIFENGADASKFKSKITRDIFYTDAELERIKVFIAQQQAARPPEPKVQQVAVQTGPAPQPAQPIQPPLRPEPRQAPQAADTAQVEFRVEGIIKIGNRGCAIINSKLWFVGKEEMGYVLQKLNAEAETVEIKTPAGRVITLGLEKTKKNDK